MDTRQYLCIDQKSFYATVECVARGLDPMTTDLVVANPERSQNTICLAISPSLKAKGVRNRYRIQHQYVPLPDCRYSLLPFSIQLILVTLFPSMGLLGLIEGSFSALKEICRNTGIKVLLSGALFRSQ